MDVIKEVEITKKKKKLNRSGTRNESFSKS